MNRKSCWAVGAAAFVIPNLLFPRAWAGSPSDNERLLEQSLAWAGSLLPGRFAGGPPALPVLLPPPALPQPVQVEKKAEPLQKPDPLEEVLGRSDLPGKIKESLAALKKIVQSDPVAGHELGHLLGALTRFLQEKRPIHFQKEVGAVARVWRSGETDQPIEVAVDNEYEDLHTILMACLLAHELQHVYDRYEGRVYTLDSEIRGYKAGAICAKVATQRFAEGIREIEFGDKSTTLDRKTLWEEMEMVDAFYNKSLRDFARAVKYGRNYMSHGEGDLSTVLSLGEALTADSEPRERLAYKEEQLARFESLLLQTRKELPQLKADWERRRTRELEVRITQKTLDITALEKKIADFKRDHSFKEMWLRRARHEWEWLRRKDSQAEYNSYLAVDSDFTGEK